MKFYLQLQVLQNSADFFTSSKKHLLRMHAFRYNTQLRPSGGMADAAVSKTVGKPCEFDSRLGHHPQTKDPRIRGSFFVFMSVRVWAMSARCVREDQFSFWLGWRA
jgi:hypothetical protein